MVPPLKSLKKGEPDRAKPRKRVPCSLGEDRDFILQKVAHRRWPSYTRTINILGVKMTIKELIDEEIGKIPEEKLEDFYEVVKQFAQGKSTEGKIGALAKLKRVKIQGPVDFAANLDLYLNGEKQLDSD